MKGEYESMFVLTDPEGQIVAFYRNDLKQRAIKMYKAEEMSLEEIKDFWNMYGKEPHKNETAPGIVRSEL